MSDEIVVGRRRVKITNRDKVLFPDDGITKGQLVDYYAAIAPRMLPHVRDRPLTMERFPDGIGGVRIMQKNVSKYFPEWIPRASVAKHGGSVTHVLANDAATLAYLGNQASITQHVWSSRIDRPNEPDQMIFDLDPTQDDFAEVRRTALLLRDLLTDLGLVPFVKTSGSRGLHVVVPLRRSKPFEAVRDAAAAIAERTAAQRPSLLTTEFMKNKREGRIFIDINRNAYAQTAVAPYSVRARRGAPVAVPLSWDEVSEAALRPDGFSMRDALERPDPWTGFRRSARALPRALANRVGR
jgi:bifunctional non-homologous end joining protein LigD